ncbi:MAG TPA: hypothetical protein VFA40_21735 [Terriglobales bacterium]|nr:hypothetical protein [Terriglobales bacterium]
MYLAGILGLCALLHVSASGHVGGGPLSFDNAAASYQEPAQQPPKSDTPAHPSEAQPDARPTAPPQDQTQPPGAGQAPTASDSVKPPSADANAPPPKKSASRKKHSAGDGGEHQKKVIHRGGTVEPTTQLAQGMTEEQAAHQRETTNKLLATTDASLQKLSGRQLSKDEQDTVTQIKRFMQQVKTADAAGDLQRAYKLAVKAHLLSDALAKP